MKILKLKRPAQGCALDQASGLVEGAMAAFRKTIDILDGAVNIANQEAEVAEGVIESYTMRRDRALADSEKYGKIRDNLMGLFS